MSLGFSDLDTESLLQSSRKRALENPPTTGSVDSASRSTSPFLVDGGKQIISPNIIKPLTRSAPARLVKYLGEMQAVLPWNNGLLITAQHWADERQDFLFVISMIGEDHN
jgi:hypothetical protein